MARSSKSAGKRALVRARAKAHAKKKPLNAAAIRRLAAAELLGLSRSLQARYAAGELTGADIPLILAVTREEEMRLERKAACGLMDPRRFAALLREVSDLDNQQLKGLILRVTAVVEVRATGARRRSAKHAERAAKLGERAGRLERAARLA